MSKQSSHRLGELLIRMKLISADQLAEALGEQANLRARNAQRQFRVGEILVFNRAINLTQLQAALRAQAQTLTNVSAVGRSLRTLGSSGPSVSVDEPSEVSRIIKGIRGIFKK